MSDERYGRVSQEGDPCAASGQAGGRDVSTHGRQRWSDADRV